MKYPLKNRRWHKPLNNMKLIMESWRGYLKEIGDASAETFDWALGPNDEYAAQYEFVSSDDPNGEEGSDYQVMFDKTKTWKSGEYVKREVPIWRLSYEADQSTMETDEGHPLRIMSTVVAIIKDFVSRPGLNRGILDFVFEGIPTAGEEVRAAIQKTKSRTSRTKMYLHFLKKHLPDNFEIRIAGKNVIFFGPKDEEEE